MNGHPDVGACGGASIGVFESAPPSWYPSVYPWIAVGEQSGFQSDITSSQGLLWGAGISIRHKAWDCVFRDNSSLLLSGRQGIKLTSGEDTEICYWLKISGWKLFYCSDLQLKHYIPNYRLSWNYICNLVSSNGLTGIVFSRYKRYFYNNLSASVHSYPKIWLSMIYARFRIYIQLWKKKNKIKFDGSIDYLSFLKLHAEIFALVRLGPWGLFRLDQSIIHRT